MAQITVTVNGRSYHITCDDGQEAHLVRLGRYMDQRARELTAAIGQVSESMVLVMTALLIADELSEAYAELEELRAGKGVGASAKREAEEAMVRALDTLTERIESIAAELERA